jgi:hypothetical protein
MMNKLDKKSLDLDLEKAIYLQLAMDENNLHFVAATKKRLSWWFLSYDMQSTDLLATHRLVLSLVGIVKIYYV